MKAIPYFGIGVLCISFYAGPAAAQDSLVHAKGLYDSASYSEALSALNQVAATVDVVEVEKYRALCLLALNRPKDAEQSLERLALAHPLYTLDGSDASPKLVALFEDVRKRTMPEASKQAYQRARADFENGDMAEAAQQFRDVLTMANAASPESAVMLEDLKMVSAGFLKLAEAALAAKSETRVVSTLAVTPTPTPPTPLPTGVGAAVPGGKPLLTVPGSSKSSPRANVVAAARARNAAALPGERIYEASDSTVKPAVSLSRPIPVWERPSALKFAAFQGILEVIVAEDGSVADASMIKPINPAYDRILLDAAQKWRFQPATIGDQRVRYRMTYSIVTPAASR
jgi:TonB family protein